MKNPKRAWMIALHLYWFLQFLLIILLAFVAILIVHAVIGNQRMIEILNILDRFFSNV
jgi:hypothetical protein